jgi:hypothetical protein
LTGAKGVGEKQLTIRFPEALHRQFKVLCAIRGEKMNDVVIRLIKKYIEHQEKREE